jgi:leucyl aminopeptidase
MPWLVESSEKSGSKQPTQLVILAAEKENLLGQVSDGTASQVAQIQAKISEVVGKQTAKVLTATWELLPYQDSLLAIGQIPTRKGLDRLDNLRLFAGSVLELARARSVETVTFALDKAEETEIKAIAEGIFLAGYEFKQYKSAKDEDKKTDPLFVFRVSPTHKTLATQWIQTVETLFVRQTLCRDLVNEPGSVLTPSVFVERIRKQAKTAGLSVEVLDEKALQKQGFQGLWTVGKGSDHPPRMVWATYDGSKKKKNAPHLVLVGKGVTFDTGGISLKPSAGMWEMKCDMAGAATAWSALLAIADLQLPIRVSAVLCLAENRPGNAAVLPGDILKAKNGKTVMVDNTDAEGRLVLSDGLWQAGALGATHIVNLATLTGAIVRALGPAIAGVFTNDSNLGETLVAAGRDESEKFCVLPLEAEYRDWLDDPVADMKNVGKAEAGAITAALFLQEFVPEKTAWAHLDIAGTAFTTSTWKYYKPGGTGFGMKTLVGLARRLAKG